MCVVCELFVTVLTANFFLSCRCQHLCPLPVQCIWLSTHWLYKVWGLLPQFSPLFEFTHFYFYSIFLTSIRTLWQPCPSYWGAPLLRSYSGPLTFMISTGMDISTKRCFSINGLFGVFEIDKYISFVLSKKYVGMCFVCLTGNDRHCKSDIWYDGEVHIPCLENWCTQAACGCLLSGNLFQAII